MSDDEIKAVATAICTAHVKEGVGDWRAYKEIATSLIAGMDAITAYRKASKIEAITSSVKVVAEHAAANPEPTPVVVVIPDAPNVTSIRKGKKKADTP